MAEHQTMGSRTLALGLALLIAAAGGAVVGGCGGHGGGPSSNGELCDQCGDTDGPCMETVTLTGTHAQELCQTSTCTVHLACFRKVDSAQRRCFPNESTFAAQQFECDGSRANRNTPTATPTATSTPTPTPSPTDTGPTPTATGPTPTGVTPTPTGVTPSATSTPTTAAATQTPTPQPTSASTCGNGILEGDEECDGSVIDNSGCAGDVCTCDDFCDGPGGTLSCNSDCTVNFSRCTAGGCSF